MPNLLIWLYYFWNGEGLTFWNQTANNIFSLDPHFLIQADELIMLISIPLLIGLISASQTITGVGLTVHQIVTQKTFLLFGLFSIIALFLSSKVSTNSLIYIAPTLAFFITQFLLTRERKWISEVVFALLLVWCLAALLLPVLAPDIFPISYELLK